MTLDRDHLAYSLNIAVPAILSAIIIYPLIHETGHLIPAVLSGAEVNQFVWTPMTGAPHVSLNNVSAVAQPCVDAGGILLPTIVGTLMIFVGFLFRRGRYVPIWQLWLLIPGIALLLGNFGLFWEVWTPPGSYHHMRLLAQQLGNNAWRSWFEVLPALWSCAWIGWLVLYCLRPRANPGVRRRYCG